MIESTKPNSPEKNFEAWEPLVLSSGYTFVYFDGLNRFYVSDEHSELNRSFYAPPNLFDNFVMQNQVKADREIGRLNSQLAEQNTSYSSLSREMESLRFDLSWARKDRDSTSTELDQTRKDRDSIKVELDKTRVDRDFIKVELDKTRVDRDFIKVELDKTRKELATFKMENEVSNKELIRMGSLISQNQAEMIFAQKDLESLRIEIQTGKEEREHLLSQLSKTQIELETARNAAEDFLYQYINILYSKSYRITAPMRILYGFLSSVRSHIRRIFSASTPIQEEPVNNLEEPPIKNDERQISKKEIHFMKLFKRELDNRQDAKSGEF